MVRRGCGGRRRFRGAAPALGMAVALGACGEVRLVDPTVTGVDAVGAFFDLRVRERGEDARLEFEGYVYGYEPMDGALLVRYLDAGGLVVAGRPAERRFVRPGEPRYRVDALLDGAPPGVAVRVGGSDAVRPCALEVTVPVAAAPAAGALVPRGADLPIPLPTVPDTLRVTDRITATAVLVGGDGAPHVAVVPATRSPVGRVLVIPAEFLGLPPPGPAELTLRIEWGRSTGADRSGAACAPAVDTRTSFEATRRVELL